MIKGNSKGLTLTELIVSFAIVAVAIVYFYQTIYTVRRLYTTAQTETQEYIDKNYAIRVADAYIDKYGYGDLGVNIASQTKICKAFNLKYLKYDYCNHIKFENKGEKLKKITIVWNDGRTSKKVSFNKAVKLSAQKYVPPVLAKGEFCIETNKFFNGPIQKKQVETITFSATTGSPDASSNDWKFWDASFEKGSKSVIAWYKESGNTTEDGFKLYDLVIGGNGKVIFPQNSDFLFYSFNNLRNIEFNNSIDTSGVISMSNMFRDCSSLNSLILTNFSTSSVHNMNLMFNDCKNLTNLDVSSFDTSGVTDTGMHQMFRGCSSLRFLHLENFNTEHVKTMSSMFSGCSALTNLYLGEDFITDNVTSMDNMFKGCEALKNIEGINKFNTSKVTDMRFMFQNCTSLTSLDLRNFTLDFNQPKLDSMFWNCNNLESLDLSNFNPLIHAYNSDGMFYKCYNLKFLNIRNFDIGSTALKALKSMFSYTGENIEKGTLIYVKDKATKDGLERHNLSALKNVQVAPTE